MNNKKNEVMVWTGARGGAGPLTTDYVNWEPYRKNVQVPGILGLWDLYKGSNGDVTVHSFVAANGRGKGKGNWVERTKFTGNLVDFLKYMTGTLKEIPANYYLVQSQAGAELTYGGQNPGRSRSCKFAVSQFDLEVS